MFVDKSATTRCKLRQERHVAPLGLSGKVGERELFSTNMTLLSELRERHLAS